MATRGFSPWFPAVAAYVECQLSSQRLAPHPPTEPVLSVGATAANSPVVSPVPRAAPHPGASSRARAAQPFGGGAVDDEDGEATNIFLGRKRQTYKRRGERDKDGSMGMLPTQPAPGPPQPLESAHHPRCALAQ